MDKMEKKESLSIKVDLFHKEMRTKFLDKYLDSKRT